VGPGEVIPRAVLSDSSSASALIAALAFVPATSGAADGSRTDGKTGTVASSKRTRGSETKTSSAAAVHALLYGLLTMTTLAITNAGVSPTDALSLVGRALFVRFLADRGVVQDVGVKKICGTRTATCFDDAHHASLMCTWLDDTFNGDFLPLPNSGSETWFEKLSPAVFTELGKILRRTTGTGQLHLEWGNSWDDLLFDHIPIGLLSQVYEEHAHRFDPVLAEMTSVRYTPRHIAEYMVNEVFFALREEARRELPPHEPGSTIFDKVAQARILDPAVGGGVFLVAALRRLAAERWCADGFPPDTTTLRKILYKQLCGFDISVPALRLCSLGLYLTAIELDPNPFPPERLVFEWPLLGTVLHDVRSKNNRQIYIGSLDPSVVGAEYHGFDVVVGNPPWKSWGPTKEITDEDIAVQVKTTEATVRKIIGARLNDETRATKYEMTDRVPDLPFAWRATEWARKGGQIALALHGRLLFKQSEAGKRARDDLFQAVTVTGVLNGTALRDTDYWPNVRAPFCLFFAQNSLPPEDSDFWLVSPELEKTLNDQGRLRIDESSSRPVALGDVHKKPWLLKCLFRGTELDVRVLEQISRVAPRTLKDYWSEQPWTDRKGQGFKVGGNDPRRPKIPASDLWGLPELKRSRSTPYLVNTSSLEKIARNRRMQHPRERSIYDGPVVLVAKSPPADRKRPAAHLAMADVAYNESFTGFSCAEHPEGELLARYLLLLFNSNLLVYRALLGSGEFGIEREAIQSIDMESLPFRPLESLPRSVRDKILPVSERLLAGGPMALAVAPNSDANKLADDVDLFAASVYNLSRVDREVIRDTLAVSPPFARNRARAQERPSPGAIETFGERLREVVQPFMLRKHRHISVRPVPIEVADLWIVFQLDALPLGAALPPVRWAEGLNKIVSDADSLAASRITVICQLDDARPGYRTILVAIVAQYRFLTPSRARMLGLDLVQEFSDILCGGHSDDTTS
jgi:hypothetical protein